ASQAVRRRSPARHRPPPMLSGPPQKRSACPTPAWTLLTDATPGLGPTPALTARPPSGSHVTAPPRRSGPSGSRSSHPCRQVVGVGERMVPRRVPGGKSSHNSFRSVVKPDAGDIIAIELEPRQGAAVEDPEILVGKFRDDRVVPGQVADVLTHREVVGSGPQFPAQVIRGRVIDDSHPFHPLPLGEFLPHHAQPRSEPLDSGVLPRQPLLELLVLTNVAVVAPSLQTPRSVPIRPEQSSEVVIVQVFAHTATPWARNEPSVLEER